MTTKRTLREAIPRQYTRLEGGPKARVVVIEVVMEATSEWNEDDVLTVAQQNGSAAVVDDYLIAESQEEAIRILGTRSKR